MGEGSQSAHQVLPATGGSTSHWGGLGVTLVDSLDTLWLMDMKDEFWEARDWVKNHLNFDKDVDASVFETTIRSLGGLLSAYDWSGDKVFLEKAQDLGDRLAKAFDAPGGIPLGQINLKTGVSTHPGWLHRKIILADMASLQVEFRHLAYVTGKQEYAKKAENVFHKLKKIEPENGLFPDLLNEVRNELQFAGKEISFGPFGDSFYEYELKIWLQGGRKEPMYREMYDRSIDGMHKEQLMNTSGLTYIRAGSSPRTFDHLTCFMGGLLALGAWSDPNGLTSELAQRDLKTGKALAYTCYQMYARMPTGLSADQVSMNGEEIVATKNEYILRPETVETFYILHKITGDPIYRQWGWEIFQSIEKYCKTDIAYGKYGNVMNVNYKPQDSMESFFTAETLKYLYLLMDPDSEVDFEDHVFNTEAHPLNIHRKEDNSAAQ